MIIHGHGFFGYLCHFFTLLLLQHKFTGFLVAGHGYILQNPGIILLIYKKGVNERRCRLTCRGISSEWRARKNTNVLRPTKRLTMWVSIRPSIAAAASRERRIIRAFFMATGFKVVKKGFRDWEPAGLPCGLFDSISFCLVSVFLAEKAPGKKGLPRRAYSHVMQIEYY